MSDKKIFIIGLPRTATTSVCQAMLELGYATAHTAYIADAFSAARVIADTPVFCDYPALDARYPGARFIYLERELAGWIPSIRRLLMRMHTNLVRTDGGFNPIIKRCYNQVFGPLTTDNIASDEFLGRCYLNHQRGVLAHFAGRSEALLRLNVGDADAYRRLLTFLGRTAPYSGAAFKPVNIAGKVTAWKEISHPLKVASTRAGKVDAVLY